MTAGPEEIARAVARLRSGGVVAFPTETVYGLGADVFNGDAVGRVFALKGRPATNPCIVHVSGEGMARRVAAAGAWTPEAGALADRFWPGPLTIVVPKAAEVPAIVTAGAETVAVRCPDHHATLALIEGLGSPIVGPSANPSGRVSPTTAEHVRASFPSEEDVLVLDGGPCRAGVESTVLALSPAARVLRSGPVSAAEIAEVIGRPVAEAIGVSVAPGAPAESPGLQPIHYAPRVPAVLFDEGDWPAVLRAAAGEGRRVAVISQRLRTMPDPHALILMPDDAREYAAKLYAALREADELDAALIAVERPSIEGPLSAAVADRLLRATRPFRA